MQNDESVPHHDLARIQELCGWRRYSVTSRAKTDAQLLGFEEKDIVCCARALTSNEFHKSKPSEKHPGRYQDAYKVLYSGKRLYVKLDADTDWATIISFHEDI